VLDVGPAYYGWARNEGLQAGPLPEGDCQEVTAKSPRALLILPGDGDEYLIDPQLPEADQTIPVRALPAAGHQVLEFRLDDGPRQRLSAPFQTRVQATRGEHRLELWLPDGAAPLTTARFRVR
jgi:penicillin-binding protein 1C